MTAGERNADVVVVGAGAAGLATAIFAARANPSLRIVALDGAKKLGAKILVSGGGRCNVTNVRVEPDDFRGASSHSIRKILRFFTAADAAEFFHELGVSMHEEEHGKLFPDSNDAQSVLTALLVEATRRGVILHCEHRVSDMVREADSFRIKTNQGSFCTKQLVLATGGKSLPKTGSDGSGFGLVKALGHSIVEPVPALVPLLLSGEMHKTLSGIAQDVTLTVRVEGAKPVAQGGALLWTHFGVSGPVVLDISGWYTRAQLAGKPALITVNFMPGRDFEQAEKWLVAFAQEHPRETLRGVLATVVPMRVGEVLLGELRMDGRTALGQLARESRRRLVHALVEWPLPVIGDRGYNYAAGTAGGVPLEEVNVSTMESRIVPGLFLVGEILNVDGRIGGFNFQWAWSTGAVAGHALGRSEKM